MVLFAAWALLLQEPGSGDDFRLRAPASSGIQIEFYDSLDVRLEAVMQTFSVQFPDAAKPDDIEPSIFLGGSKLGRLEVDELELETLFGLDTTFDFTIARLVLEMHFGSARETEFEVANPGGGAPGRGTVDWDVRMVRLGLERPLVAVRIGSLRLMLDAGVMYYNLSAKPDGGEFTVDVPPVTAGVIGRQRQEANGVLGRVGIHGDAQLWTRVYLTMAVHADVLGWQARGSPVTMNFGIVVRF
jgi:hypothetical protein